MKKKGFSEKMRNLYGEYTIKVVGPDGRIKQQKTFRNKIVDAAIAKIIERLFNASPTSTLLVGYIAVGDDNTAPAAGDTTLVNELGRAAVTSRTHSGNVGSCATIFNAGDLAADTYEEFAVFIEGSATPDSGILLSRALATVTITALDSLFVDWRVTGADA